MTERRSFLTAWLTTLAIAGAAPVSAQVPVASESERPPDEALVADPADPEGAPPPPAPIGAADDSDAAADEDQDKAPADPAEDDAPTAEPAPRADRDQPAADDGYLHTRPKNKKRKTKRKPSRRGRQDRRDADDDGALPPPDAPSSIDLWATAGLVAGCTLCGGVPVLIGAALIAAGAFVISASLQAGGCGAIFGVLFGIIIAILGVFPMSIVGLTGTGGTLAGGTLARLLQGENVLPTVLGPLLGVLPAVLAIGILLGGGSLVSSLAGSGTGMMTADWLLPALGGVAGAAVLLSLLAGPVAIAGGVGAIALWPALAEPEPPARRRRAAVESAPPRRLRARAAVGDVVKMAY